jgi:hypothetical protein
MNQQEPSNTLLLKRPTEGGLQIFSGSPKIGVSGLHFGPHAGDALTTKYALGSVELFIYSFVFHLMLMKYAFSLNFFFHLLLMKYAYGPWMSFNNQNALHLVLLYNI